MSSLSAPSSEAVDECLNVLAHEQCRAILYYFAHHSNEVATVDALANFIRNEVQQDADETRIATRLHHTTLPRLAHAGVLEYDSRSHTVRYRDNATVEAMVNRLFKREDELPAEWS